MKFLLFILLLFFLVAFAPSVFFFITNIHNFTFYSFKDLYNYFHLKKYNLFSDNGKIILYSGSGSQVFGSGKTLSMIRDVINIYRVYDNKVVWDDENKKFTTQNIHIISNVELTDVPYIKFNGVNQFVDLEKYNFGSMDVTIFVLDESGAIFNSREFRDNISSEFLTRLLQSRKNKCCMFMTSQRLQFTDKILRQICSTVVSCHKTWRVITNYDYSPLDLEYAVNPELVRPRSKKYWFATDNVFKQYNTF